MRAEDLREDFPSIEVGATAQEAARLIGAERHSAVIVVDQGRPVTVLTASQVLGAMVPGYLQEDPNLVRVYGERAADACAGRLDAKTVKDLLPPKDRRTELPVVDDDATTLECAALMSRLKMPILVVASDEKDGVMLGAITASRVLQHLVARPEQPEQPAP
ncbi:hypothetical protein GCM10011519_14030 [Marmoricola endophyticus]|uniref:CBS domain-containing protein n=1 Tax=Marmoricola endophyticus TaxID=2040280 RepID=A0A917BIE4_9ACTN|nr:CBS domain-containing protein [Marmoricola endophyticus]GGF41418.1 hypothetical protein GCM10011519_14030 [Marmoricola endophyticus]